MVFRDTGGSNSTATLPNPLYGYEIILRMPIRIERLQSGSYTVWDNDSDGSSDSYALKATWQMGQSASDSMLDFFDNKAYGRGESCTIVLGASPTGFFPFGPTLGDVGNFTIKMRKIEPSGMQYQPFRYYNIDTEFLLVTPPAYTPGAAVSEGGMSIGTVTGLKYPIDGWKSVKNYGARFDPAIFRGTARIDQGPGYLTYQTEMTLEANNANAAAVITYLTGANGRGQGWTLTCPGGNYPFGPQLGETHTVVLVDAEIVMKHASWNRWQITMRLARTA
jgi:hypothetical protein